MLTFLPSFLVGIISLILNGLNTLIVPALALILALIRPITPFKSWRQGIDHFNHHIIPWLWVINLNWITRLTTTTEWEIEGTRQLSPQKWYLLMSNHQSWLDIMVLEKAFFKQVPMLKFFMKRELLWALPVAGMACWALGFPFVKRYSKEYLQKHPEKRGKDLEITKRACEKFKDQPVTIVNYVEGTRFTPKKQAHQHSPFQNLLKPKSGGLAFTIAAMAGHLDGILNTTIVYPPHASLWQFMSGRVKKIIVRYEVLPVPTVTENYFNDADERHQFQAWLNQVWQQKDQLLTTLKADLQ